MKQKEEVAGDSADHPCVPSGHSPVQQKAVAASQACGTSA